MWAAPVPARPRCPECRPQQRPEPPPPGPGAAPAWAAAPRLPGSRFAPAAGAWRRAEGTQRREPSPARPPEPGAPSFRGAGAGAGRAPGEGRRRWAARRPRPALDAHRGCSGRGVAAAPRRGARARMPVLERFFPAAEPGRRRRTGEEPMPFPMGSLPGYQQGTLAWDLPEMIKMVKLVWKSKGELRGAKHRGVLESEDALGGSAGRFPPPYCSGRLRGKRGWGPGVAESRGRSRPVPSRRGAEPAGVRPGWEAAPALGSSAAAGTRAPEFVPRWSHVSLPMALPPPVFCVVFIRGVIKARLKTRASRSAARRLSSAGAAGLGDSAESSPGAPQPRPRGQGDGEAAPRARRAARPLQELPRLCSPCPCERMASPLPPPNLSPSFACAGLPAQDLPAFPLCKAERLPYDLAFDSRHYWELEKLSYPTTFSLNVVYYWIKSTCFFISCINLACQFFPNVANIWHVVTCFTEVQVRPAAFSLGRDELSG